MFTPLTLPKLSRPQTVKKIWEYVKANNLQKPDDKRQIMCDDAMRAVFKQDTVHMFTMVSKMTRLIACLASPRL